VSRYRKFLVALLPFAVLVITEVQEALRDVGTPQRLTGDELIAILLTLLGAVAVYLAPNDPPEGEPAQPGVSERDV
jgi:hypothetical protein